MAVESKNISHYIITGLLGSGGFGKVYQCLDSRTGMTFAMKTISKEGIKESDLADLRAEIQLLKSLKHPNVIKYNDTVVVDGCLYVVLEYAERGSLAQVLKQFEEGLPEPLVQVYIRQVITGLSYLHSEGVIHRDIKGANLLMTKEGVVKLTDFGVATRQGMDGAEDVVGTPYWMAPEIIEMRNQTPKCDIWSLGCTTVELLTGKPPYFDLDPMPALFRIVQDDHPDIPGNVSSSLEVFLLQCFQKDPNLRPSAEELQNNSWFKSGLTKEVNQQTEAWVNDEEDVAGILAEGVNRRKQIVDEINETQDDQYDDEDSRNFSESFYSQDEEDDYEYGDADENDGFNEHSQDYDSTYGSYEDDGLEKYREHKDEDYGLGEIEIDLENFENAGKENGDDGDEEVGAKEEEDEEDDSDNSEDFDISDDYAREIDQATKGEQEVKTLLRGLESSWQSEKIKSTVQRLSAIFEENQQQIATAMSYHGVIPIMEMLDHKQTSESRVTMKVLGLVNQIINHEDGQIFLESLCLVGLIPAVSDLFFNLESYEIRQAAAELIKRFCATDPSNNFVRKMFVASDGIKILVSMLDVKQYEKDKRIILGVLDCIYDIFRNPLILIRDGYDKKTKQHPKRDFCRLFTKAGLLRRLVVLLRNLILDEEFDAFNDYVNKVGWLLFTIANQNDPVVKKAFVKTNVLPAILRILNLLRDDGSSKDLLLHILKIMRALTDPSTVEKLIYHKGVSGVCPFLNSSEPEIQMQVIMCMFHMVKLEKKCREEAALCGTIPILMDLTQKEHISREFVVAILCKMTEFASGKTLYELKKHNGIEFFLDMVENTKRAYIEVEALQAVANWLRADHPRVEIQLCQPHHVTKLISVFKNPKNKKEFLKILSSFHEMIKISKKLADCVGTSDVFLYALANWLKSPELSKYTSDHTHTLLTLLQFTFNLFDQLSSRSKVRFVQILFTVIERIAENYDKHLVKLKAQKIISFFNESVDKSSWPLNE